MRYRYIVDGLAAAYGLVPTGDDRVVLRPGAFRELFVDGGYPVPLWFRHKFPLPAGRGLLTETPEGLAFAGSFELDLADIHHRRLAWHIDGCKGLSIHFTYARRPPTRDGLEVADLATAREVSICPIGGDRRCMISSFHKIPIQEVRS
ncbi:MAG TPA: hypothetical protein VFY29_07205 [Terriglobia bacterium]|nr:hypothetical protein [Terriglobia bacterium]